jgi:hypothetical protein
MSDVKALFPIGKTQWAKWTDAQKIAFNETRAAGVPFADAVKYVNENDVWDAPEIVKAPKKNILDVIEDVAEVATTVASVAASVSPVVAVAKTVAKATKKKGK